MQTEILKITGMTSEACAEAVKRALQALNGVSSTSVNFLCTQAVVQFDERALSKRDLHAAIKQAGYGVVGVRAVDLSGNVGGGCGGANGCSCG